MKLLSTKEAAAIISERTGKPISLRQVQHEISLGHLNAQRIGERSYIISEEDLDNYVRRHPGRPSK